MKRFAAAVVLCLFGLVASAQAATVEFDAAAGTTIAAASGWTSVLYVNGTAFPLVHTCALVGTTVTCSAPLPTIAGALTPSGTQSFQVSFVDPILGEGLKSPPFLRDRPAAPISPRFK